jgi:hypothetical protein
MNEIPMPAYFRSDTKIAKIIKNTIEPSLCYSSSIITSSVGIPQTRQNIYFPTIALLKTDRYSSFYSGRHFYLKYLIES